jgi:tetrahydromethanopterin S-methyltransferase subunit G
VWVCPPNTLIAPQDLEAVKKKLSDVEAKLKVAVADKQAALQVS